MSGGGGPVGRTRDAGWQIGVSRTVDHPAERVWDLLTSERGTALWLGLGARLSTQPGEQWDADDGTTGEVRGFRPHDRVRLTHRAPGDDRETTVQVVVRAHGDGRAIVTFHQERLADAAARERQRTHWRAVMDAVVEALDAP